MRPHPARRVHRLLSDFEPDIVQEAYRDDQSRYVLVVQYSNGDLYSLAEWPKSLQVVSTWTDRTVLAADDGGGPVTLLALTPTDDGRMRTDPVPMPTRSSGCLRLRLQRGTPSTTTYGAILRCALGDTTKLSRIRKVIVAHRADGTPVSQLWQAISTTKGPLRTSWPQVQMWAGVDRRSADEFEPVRHPLIA